MIAVLVTVAAVAGYALARVVGIPDPDGGIHACYNTTNGNTRIVQSAANCRNGEAAITWNQTGPPGPGVATVSGFVYNDGTQYGHGFTVTKLGTGHYLMVLPYTTFTDFPAIAVSGWGLPGQAPTVNVLYNIAGTTGYESEIYVFAADGVTVIDSGFQFVAAQVSP